MKCLYSSCHIKLGQYDLSSSFFCLSLSSLRKVVASPTTPQFLSPTAQRSSFSLSFTNTVSFTLPVCLKMQHTQKIINPHLQSSCPLWNFSEYHGIYRCSSDRESQEIKFIGDLEIGHLTQLYNPRYSFTSCLNQIIMENIYIEL